MTSIDNSSAISCFSSRCGLYWERKTLNALSSKGSGGQDTLQLGLKQLSNARTLPSSDH